MTKKLTPVINATHLKHKMHTILVDRFHNVTLFANAKAGCSTWKLTLLNSSGTWTNTKDVHDVSTYRYLHGMYTRSAERMSVTDVLTALNTHCTIVNVRHPFDRLESAFMDKVVTKKYNSLRSEILNARGDARSQLHSNENSIQFYEFVRHVLRNNNDEHWKLMVRNSLLCEVPYGYVFQ